MTFRTKTARTTTARAKTAIAAALLTAGTFGNTFAFDSDAALQTALEKRVAGDRSGACVAVALVGEGATRRAIACADPAKARKLDFDTAFEIGSITKTMTAYLVADLIEQGKMSLDDPIAKHLPSDTKLPTWQGKPILVRHVLTHTSGLPALPSRMGNGSQDNPYSKLTPQLLLESLGEAKLTREPGAQFEYSNFAMMVMSLAVTRAAGQDFEPLLQARLFAPLGMKSAYVTNKPAGVTAATGHATKGVATPAWTLTPNLAGVGMVRASLNDMVAYARAVYGDGPRDVTARFTKTQEPLFEAGQNIGMNWVLRKAGKRTYVEHNGGTGGFSSQLTVDVGGKRAVILLQDTAGHGFNNFAEHVLDTSRPAGAPRVVTMPSAELLKALAGDYMIGDTLPLKLSARDGKLVSQARGQTEFELGYDSEGNFFVIEFEATIRVAKRGDGYGLTLQQGGGAVPIRKATSTAPLKVPVEVLKAYEGTYPLSPTFKLKVFVQGDQLIAQATGQGAFAVQAQGNDVFVEPAYGIRLAFKRSDGKVAGLHFTQGSTNLNVDKE